MNINLHFTEEDRERIERNWVAWWAGELDKPIVVIKTMDTLFNSAPEEFSREFLLEKRVNEVIDYFQVRLEATHFYGDALPTWWPNLGPGIVTGFLGGKVEPRAEQHTVWFEADEPVPVEDLHFVYDANNIWRQRVLNLTRAAVEQWDDQVYVGHTDLGGVLDIVASFRTTTQLLYDLHDAPEEVNRMSRAIRSLWMRYYDELYTIIEKTQRGTTNWAAVWSPERTYMHQCDFSYMISPKMFERFVLPDLAACFERINHNFYHLDGKGQIPHLDMLLSMESLAGIQWIPGAGQPEAAQWLSLLKRIQDAGKLCQVFVNAKGAQTIVQELGGRGFALFIMSETPMSCDDAEDLLKVLVPEDISRR